MSIVLLLILSSDGPWNFLLAKLSAWQQRAWLFALERHPFLFAPGSKLASVLRALVQPSLFGRQRLGRNRSQSVVEPSTQNMILLSKQTLKISSTTTPQHLVQSIGYS
jgi:hypothetical protein